MRGEHFYTAVYKFRSEGSPPHARGTLRRLGGEAFNSRITPACAGNTQGGYRVGLLRQDHPRMRGDTSRLTPQTSEPQDHPRMRGEHFKPVTAGSRLTVLGLID